MFSFALIGDVLLGWRGEKLVACRSDSASGNVGAYPHAYQAAERVPETAPCGRGSLSALPTINFANPKTAKTSAEAAAAD